MSLFILLTGQDKVMSLKEIKKDLISEAELLVYQMKAAHLSSDYEAVNKKADTLTNVCKKLEFIREEEKKLQEEMDY